MVLAVLIRRRGNIVTVKEQINVFGVAQRPVEPVVHIARPEDTSGKSV